MREELNLLPQLETEEILSFLDEVYVLAKLLDYEILVDSWSYCNIKTHKDEEPESGTSWRLDVLLNNVAIYAMIFNKVNDQLKRFIIAKSKDMNATSKENQIFANIDNKEELLKVQMQFKEWL